MLLFPILLVKAKLKRPRRSRVASDGRVSLLFTIIPSRSRLPALIIIDETSTRGEHWAFVVSKICFFVQD